MIDPVFTTGHVTLYLGDALAVLREMPDESVDCVVTSPPYWGLRDYGVVGQLGLELTPAEYVAAMVHVFREVRRVLAGPGTVWLNLGDSYMSRPDNFEKDRKGTHSTIGTTAPFGTLPIGPRAPQRTTQAGLKPKDMVGIPWRVAFALQADGWYLRSDIIWSKPNPMPESVTDRPTKAHEYVFLLTKSARYFFDSEAVREQSETRPQRRLTAVADQPGAAARVAARGHNPMSQGGAPTKRDKQRLTGEAHIKGGDRWSGFNERWDASEDAGEVPLGRNIRSVWEIATQPYPEAHFATFPREIPERCIKAGCPADGVVLDPFAGSGTTLAVARDLGRRSIGIELNPAYVGLIEKRCAQLALEMGA